MQRRVNLVGQAFGRLAVMAYAGADAHSNARWSCSCSCGNTRVVFGFDLKKGHTTSCGCWRKENNQRIGQTHGLSGLPEYRVWWSMRARCRNPKDKNWPYYGGRGVTVWPVWDKSFVPWFEYMGRKPSRRHTIDRIDPNGNYEPGNVRWATWKQQARNKRGSWCVGGKTQAQWAKELGISQSAVSRRFKTHRTVHLPK